MRNKIVAGNWKMHKNLSQGSELLEELQEKLQQENLENVEVIVIPPALHLSEAVNLLDGSEQISVGAQNCHFEKEGAFTGEISAWMLSDGGIDYVIIGHSERRQFFNEDNEMLAKKVKAVLNEGMSPIYCCGEMLEEREAGTHFTRIQNQIEEGLFSLSAEEAQGVIVAYEPVWAIGTGVTASKEQAQEMHAFIRNLITEKYGEKVAQRMSILYGGSVKGSNAAELFSQPDIDGGLVGGASLKADDFLAIIRAAIELTQDVEG